MLLEFHQRLGSNHSCLASLCIVNVACPSNCQRRSRRPEQLSSVESYHISVYTWISCRTAEMYDCTKRKNRADYCSLVLPTLCPMNKSKDNIDIFLNATKGISLYSPRSMFLSVIYGWGFSQAIISAQDSSSIIDRDF